MPVLASHLLEYEDLRFARERPLGEPSPLSSASAPIQTGWDWVSPRMGGLVRVDNDNLDPVKLVGKELSFLRAASGSKVEEAVLHVNTTKRRLEQIERGEKPVSIEVMLKLAAPLVGLHDGSSEAPQIRA